MRFLGHSCVEIIGRTHILIDPDFTRWPKPGVEFILVTHAHRDHIGRIAEIPTGIVLAAADVCEIAVALGVPNERLHPVKAGDSLANIDILEGFSKVGGLTYNFFHYLFRGRFPDMGGTPLSFLVKDSIKLLHIGDAHECKLAVSPDILCLPWRTSPYWPKRYKQAVGAMANSIVPHYVLPIHHDLPGTEADPAEIKNWVKAEVLSGTEWKF